MSINQRKKKDIEDRISSIEDDLGKAHEYLATGANANWRGFPALFKQKIVDGKAVPPHTDWVKNVFIPSRQRALKKAEKILDRFDATELERLITSTDNRQSYFTRDLPADAIAALRNGPQAPPRPELDHLMDD